MPQSVAELVDLLDLEEIEVGLFRARQPDTQLQRVFGGQVLAQALIAAARTVAVTRVVHSLHAYFLLPGRTDIPIVYDVEAVRDGGSFSSRRVVARQGGKVIFYLSSSFHEVEDGLRARGPGARRRARPRTSARRWARCWPRPPGARRRCGSASGGCSTSATSATPGRAASLIDPPHPARARVWVRADGVLPDDRRLHQAALAYASDLTLLSAEHRAARRLRRTQRAGGLAGPRDVVPPTVPRRRLAALRPDLPVGVPRPGPVHRPPVPGRRLVANVAQEGLLRSTK